jgi:hypothetical protein
MRTNRASSTRPKRNHDFDRARTHARKEAAARTTPSARTSRARGHASASAPLPLRRRLDARPHLPADRAPRPEDRQTARDGRHGAGLRPGHARAIVFSAWGPNTEWIRNLRAHPALQIQIGRESYIPEQRFLSEDESIAVVDEFRRRHPWRVRLFAAILGWGGLSSDTAVREFVRDRPFVLFRPAPPRDPDPQQPA